MYGICLSYREIESLLIFLPQQFLIQPVLNTDLHNIDTTFENNSLLEISNWEGSGVDSEHESSAIQAFIASRLVHAIWYCVPSNLGQAKKFLSVPYQVPVIAVFTDFDRLMDETIYTLCTDDNAARESVVQQFEAGYKTVLMQTPYLPMRLSQYPTATMTSLRSGDELARGLSGHRLEALFVAAQRADVDPKYQLSLLYGLPDTISQIELEVPRLPFRRRLIQIWGTSFTVTEILSTFKKYVENDRRTIGNSAVGSIPRPELAAMSALERKGCRCAQLVADLTFIMAQIFLLKIQKAYVLEALIKEYTGSDAFRSIQEGVIKIYRSSRRNRQSLGDGTRIVMPQIQRQLEDLVRRVSSNAADRFRLLIIGKPGDAKVTILHKVLGEGSLSTVPKIVQSLSHLQISNEYRIFAETTSSDNGFLVVHDADEPEGQKELVSSHNLWRLAEEKT
ncbi:hypothetical protein DFJ58DRAFT_879739 [Suillus subalutaceus]|uniref:uncharacterized protein n=1 Tax=Suillus subalutaceus TaxID=48586 RepID=UPI001B86851D|nr:uncharacterized protein DFJ58DRAFT_879739 [Suillus subalutaceus]KAG1827861.1 hypothetical protein DFJ58DRAFT_879739 [Suillus subalutaceus]